MLDPDFEWHDLDEALQPDAHRGHAGGRRGASRTCCTLGGLGQLEPERVLRRRGTMWCVVRRLRYSGHGRE